MKTKNLYPILSLLSLPLLADLSFAQVSPSSGAPSNNQSGDAGTAPASLDIDYTDLAKWIIRRLHTVQLDGLSPEVGADPKKFVLGFSAEGALVYNYELKRDDIEEWDEIGRNAGLQLIPFTIQTLSNGVKKVTVDAIAFRNMNGLMNTEIGKHQYGAEGFWRVVNRLDALSFTWDENYAFNSIKSFNVNFVNAELKVGLSEKDSKKNYLAVTAGGNVGANQTEIAALSEQGYSIDGKNFGSKYEYIGGLELTFQSDKNVKLTLQSRYLGGSQVMKLKIDENRTSAIRNYGMFIHSVDLSAPIKKQGRPMRVGLGAEARTGRRDQVQITTGNLDLTPYQNQVLNVRLYLNF